MLEWAYEMPDRDLIDALVNACTGSAGSNAEEVSYLKGVLLARLKGVRLPFKRGDIVKSKGNGVHSADYWSSTVLPASHQKIQQIYYKGGRWLLEFENFPTVKFDAVDFKSAGKTKVGK